MDVGGPPPLAERHAALAWPHPLRRHQREALDALDAAWEAGRRRAWVVLPPGAGKTLVGLETVRRAGTRAVVLSPNTAIQGQWVRSWGRYVAPGGAEPVSASPARDLSADLTSLTYQSIAVFGDEDDAEPGEHAEPVEGAELGRLHPNGRALVQALQDAGPLTLVLDECHHLLEVWGRLLSEILELLPEARVLGLTATPAARLTADQSRLVDDLFGDVVYATSIPAVVREGHLAPFADLVWLTSPTAQESEWLAAQGERFAELTTALVDPAFGSVPFLSWMDRRFVGPMPFARIASKEPELADAALRLAHAGLLDLPDDVARGERHHQRPTAEDWVLLIDDWYDACLVDSTDDRDEEVRLALRRALPAVGHQLTRRGLRRGRSGVDRVLARSESKSRALVEIVAAEHRALGDRLAMLVITDHESASATVSVDLRQVLDGRSGSARLALATLLADPVTHDLAPVMVTGRTVAGAPDVLAALAQRVRTEHGVDVVVTEADAEGVAELVAAPSTGRGAGGWASRVWVRAVTDFFCDGSCRVLIGTRALLGEGWDAPAASGLVDLSMGTTAGTVVQTRGRTLRLDPEHPSKVAVNWTVTCVADGPRGDNDWRRTVAKHEGYFGVDDTGDVVDGVAHIHPELSPHHPPAPETFDRVNAAMLDRAERRADIAAAWRVGEPYDDEAGLMVWLRPTRRSPTPVVAPRATHDVVPVPPTLTLGADGLRGLPLPEPRSDRVVVCVILALLVAIPALLAAGVSWVVAVVLLLSLVAAVGVQHLRERTRHRAVLAAVGTVPDAVTVAHVVADALRSAGLTTRGADAVEWHVARDGTLRFRLDGGDEPGRRRFAEALAEAVAPIGSPRYLVPRYLTGARAERWSRGLETYRPEGVVWHAVPSLLGVRAETAQAYGDAWQRWVGGGPAVFTATPEGAGALAGSRGSDPFDVTSVLRLGWS